MLGAYLHQDWARDYATAEYALNESVADASRERLTSAAAELQTHRPPRDDEEATRRFLNALCDYHPPGDGFTYVAWLDHVQAVLDDAASA
jgi:CdiI immunity protein